MSMVHCPNCGSIYSWEWGEGGTDLTIEEDGTIRCHVCKNALGAIVKRSNLRPHTEPFTECYVCKELEK